MARMRFMQGNKFCHRRQGPGHTWWKAVFLLLLLAGNEVYSVKSRTQSFPQESVLLVPTATHGGQNVNMIKNMNTSTVLIEQNAKLAVTTGIIIVVAIYAVSALVKGITKATVNANYVAWQRQYRSALNAEDGEWAETLRRLLKEFNDQLFATARRAAGSGGIQVDQQLLRNHPEMTVADVMKQFREDGQYVTDATGGAAHGVATILNIEHLLPEIREKAWDWLTEEQQREVLEWWVKQHFLHDVVNFLDGLHLNPMISVVIASFRLIYDMWHLMKDVDYVSMSKSWQAPMMHALSVNYRWR